MSYSKRYNLTEIKEIINKLIEDGKKNIDIEDLLIEIGFNPLDIQKFYIKNIKHRIRYEKR